MKKRLLLTAACCAVFFGLLFALTLSANADGERIRDSVFRFHVIANSDSDADQSNKLAVRDGVAQLCSELFENSDSKAQSMEIAENNIEKITAQAKRILELRGDDSDVTVTVTKRFFPTRHYNGVSLPAGNYDTLDIRIGSAQGHNFWCVMFPDICIGASDKTDNKQKMSTVLQGSALHMATDSGGISFKFKIVEIIENVRHRFARR